MSDDIPEGYEIVPMTPKGVLHTTFGDYYLLDKDYPVGEEYYSVYGAISYEYCHTPRSKHYEIIPKIIFTAPFLVEMKWSKGPIMVLRKKEEDNDNL